MAVDRFDTSDMANPFAFYFTLSRGERQDAACVCPVSPVLSILSISDVTATSIRVNFSDLIQDNITIENPDSYAIFGPNTIDVMYVARDTPLDSVVLTTSEFRQGGSYTLVAYGFQFAGADVLTALFTGVGVRPRI